MNTIKNFFKEKGVYLALLACIFTAAGASFWAIRSVVEEISSQEEKLQWELPGQIVENEAQDVPVTQTPAPSSQPWQAGASGGSTSGAASTGDEHSGDAPVPSAPPVASPIWPVEGQVLMRYSGDELVYNETMKDWRTHNGMDISAPVGDRVVAALDGTITAVYADPLLGGVVEQEADGKIWRYCGLDKIKVEAGQTVEAGDTLGRLETADGESAGESHLHLELLKDGNYLDPETVLKHE